MMAMRSVLRSPFSLSLTRPMETAPGAIRNFSDGKSRVLSEEERAKETIFIQKMEREKLEKQRLQSEKEEYEKAKEKADKKTDDGK